MRPLHQVPFYAQWRLPLLRSVLDSDGGGGLPRRGCLGAELRPLQ